jgi:hypothetical protein
MQLELDHQLYKAFMKKANANGNSVKGQIVQLMQEFIKEEFQRDYKEEKKEDEKELHKKNNG